MNATSRDTKSVNATFTDAKALNVAFTDLGSYWAGGGVG